MKQRGQTLVFVGVMGLVLIAAILLVYDVGRLVTAKIRFQNGADGAAVAAVALKASKHHLDTLLRWEMTQTARLAQLEIEGAKAALVAMGSDPSKMASLRLAYQGHVARAKALQGRLTEERTLLARFYGAVSSQPMEGAVLACAQAAYRPNVSGSEADNHELVLNGGLTEFQGPKVGGVFYHGERANRAGAFGKSLVEISPQHQAQGVSILQYPERFALNTHAAAQLVSNPTAVGGFTRMNWYGPRLFLSVPDEESRGVAF